MAGGRTRARTQIRQFLPVRLWIASSWTAVYSTYAHGMSLHTLLERAHQYNGPTLLIVRDTAGAVRPRPPFGRLPAGRPRTWAGMVRSSDHGGAAPGSQRLRGRGPRRRLEGSARRRGRRTPCSTARARGAVARFARAASGRGWQGTGPLTEETRTRMWLLRSRAQFRLEAPAGRHAARLSVVARQRLLHDRVSGAPRELPRHGRRVRSAATAVRWRLPTAPRLTWTTPPGPRCPMHAQRRALRALARRRAAPWPLVAGAHLPQRDAGVLARL